MLIWMREDYSKLTHTMGISASMNTRFNALQKELKNLLILCTGRRIQPSDQQVAGSNLMEASIIFPFVFHQFGFVCYRSGVSRDAA